jgi:hypothetical protein
MDGGDPRRLCRGRVVRIRQCGAEHPRLGAALRSRVVSRTRVASKAGAWSRGARGKAREAQRR